MTDESRREFLKKTGVSLALTVLPGATRAEPASHGIPRRTLGRTGASVSLLAFGCGSRFLMYENEEDALGVLNRAIDGGVTYLDTAVAYGDGKSEMRVGKVMKSRRGEVFLATKVPERSRTRDAALREVEASLGRLQTDHVDLLHVHSLGDAADLARVGAKDGALQALYQLRDQKVARFIGMTSHTDGNVMAEAISRHDIDCVQMAMNPARASAFEEKALPAAVGKRLGVLLMKSTGQDKLLGGGPASATASELLRYAWSLPVAAAVVGMPRVEHLEANLAVARSFTPLSASQMDALRERFAPARAAVQEFFAHHRDLGRA